MHSVFLQSFLLVFVRVCTHTGFVTGHATDVEGTQTFAGHFTRSKTLQ